MATRSTRGAVCWIVVWCAFCVLGNSPTTAQSLDRLADTEASVAYYFYARPGDATVQVSVWGTIGNTGIYEVPTDTQLDKLLTMAGGAPIDTRQRGQDPDDIRITLYRTGEDGDRTIVYEEPLEHLVQNPEYPALQDDDILVVELERARTPFRFRDVLGIVSSLASLTLLGLRIFDRN